MSPQIAFLAGSFATLVAIAALVWWFVSRRHAELDEPIEHVDASDVPGRREVV